MMRLTLTLMIVAALALPGCKEDETVASYGALNSDWKLTELDGQPFEAKATLIFAEEGKISGEAPCNRFFGQQTAPYPWFKAEGLGATRRACPDLDKETAYLSALAEMSQSEVVGDTLLLSNDAGREMVFKAVK